MAKKGENLEPKRKVVEMEKGGVEHKGADPIMASAPKPPVKPIQPPRPKGIYISNEAWGQIIGELSVFKPIVVEAVSKTIQKFGELR